jgi:two-component system, cell cycle sensor histidine kinase and response regulator CckA
MHHTTAEIQPLAGKEPSTQSSPVNLSILVVDDEPAMRLLSKSMMENLGYATDAASSGEEAVNKYRDALEQNKPFSLVVMDLALPGGMSGIEATAAIKRIDPQARIIVSSGYLEHNARKAALEHGFAGILPKPYTIDHLATELRWVMKNS